MSFIVEADPTKRKNQRRKTNKRPKQRKKSLNDQLDALSVESVEFVAALSESQRQELLALLGGVPAVEKDSSPRTQATTELAPVDASLPATSLVTDQQRIATVKRIQELQVSVKSGKNQLLTLRTTLEQLHRKQQQVVDEIVNLENKLSSSEQEITRLHQGLLQRELDLLRQSGVELPQVVVEAVAPVVNTATVADVEEEAARERIQRRVQEARKRLLQSQAQKNAARKAEAAKTEQAKSALESAKAQQAKSAEKAEPVKADPVKADPVTAEPVKAEPVKAEPENSHEPAKLAATQAVEQPVQAKDAPKKGKKTKKPTAETSVAEAPGTADTQATPAKVESEAQVELEAHTTTPVSVAQVSPEQVSSQQKSPAQESNEQLDSVQVETAQASLEQVQPSSEQAEKAPEAKQAATKGTTTSPAAQNSLNELPENDLSAASSAESDTKAELADSAEGSEAKAEAKNPAKLLSVRQKLALAKQAREEERKKRPVRLFAPEEPGFLDYLAKASEEKPETEKSPADTEAQQ